MVVRYERGMFGIVHCEGSKFGIAINDAYSVLCAINDAGLRTIVDDAPPR
jgi:hypothetical protein